MTKLDDIVDKYYRTIKTKPIDVISKTHFDFVVESNDKDLQFEVGDFVIIPILQGFVLHIDQMFLLLKKLKYSTLGICNRKP